MEVIDSSERSFTDRGTQYNMDDTVSSDSFSPKTSSSFKEEEYSSEDGISVTKSRGCQTVSFSDTGTQTSSPISTDSDKDAFHTSMAVLMNRYLHSSYWYFVMVSLASEEGYSGLKKNLQTRRSLAENSASRILADLVSNNKVLLADIAKPNVDFSDFKTSQMVEFLKEIDQWLLSSLSIVMVSALEHGSDDQIKLLEELKVELMILSRESELMNSQTFVTMH